MLIPLDNLRGDALKIAAEMKRLDIPVVVDRRLPWLSVSWEDMKRMPLTLLKSFASHRWTFLNAIDPKFRERTEVVQ